jgi:tripeptide aminopeptidase
MVKKERLIKTFLELVQIDSPSGEEAEVAKYLKTKLADLRLTVELDNYGNVIAKLPGKGEPMMLNAHMDTVEPGREVHPVVEQDIIRTDGTTVLGADPKSGVAAILEAVESIVEDQKDHLPLELVFTRQEEIGLVGAQNLDFSKITAKRGVTFDGEAEVGNIFISAPHHVWLDITVTGKSAHAGVEPEKGLSAIKIGAGIIADLELGRIDEETTANIGLIEGGSAVNAIPEKVTIKGEIRSRSERKLKNHQAHFNNVLKKLQNKYPQSKIEIKIENHPPGYVYQSDHPTLQHVIKVMDKHGFKNNPQHTMGGTDVNVFKQHGIQAICVGAGDHNAHTTREFVSIPQMLEAAVFAEKLIEN